MQNRLRFFEVPDEPLKPEERSKIMLDLIGERNKRYDPSGSIGYIEDSGRGFTGPTGPTDSSNSFNKVELLPENRGEEVLPTRSLRPGSSRGSSS